MKKEKYFLLIFAVISMIAELIFFSMQCFSFALKEATGNWFDLLLSSIPLMILSFIASLTCIILSIGLLRERTKPFLIIATIFICISLVILTPFTSIPLSKQFCGLFRPLADAYHTNRVVQEHDKYERTRLAHYPLLLEQFKSPQKVIAVKGYHLLLDNGMRIRLYNFSYESGLSHEECERRCEDFLKAALLQQNKLVQIRLPDRSKFLDYYQLGIRDSAGFDKLRPWPGDYGEIPAFIYVDGQLLNIKYGK